MRIARTAALLFLALTLPAAAPLRATADDKHDHWRSREYHEGHAYCPHRPMVVGRVVVPAGRCYTMAVLRNEHGGYLAFLDPDVRLHPGVERLEGREGHRIRDRILFLVPVRDQRIGRMPVNTIQLIRYREEEDMVDEGDGARVRSSRLVVIVPGEPEPPQFGGPSISGTIVINF